MLPSRLACLCLGLPLSVLSAAAPGDPWILVSPPPPRLSELVRVDDTLFAMTQVGRYALDPAALTWSPRPGDFPPAPPLPGDARGWPPVSRGPMFPGLIADTSLTVLSDSNLFHYRYNGMNWIPWKLANPGLGTLKEIFLHRGVLLVAGARGLARSQDDGKTWAKPALPAGIPTFTSFCARGDTLYAGVSLSPSEYVGGLFRSLDGGATWASRATPTALHPRVLLAASRQGPLVMVMTQNLYVSTNGGGTWRQRGPDLMLGSGPESWVEYDGRTLLVHRGDSFSVSLDSGLSWTRRVLPDSFRSTYAGPDRMALSESALWFVSKDNALYSSRDGGLTWTRADNLPGRPALVRAEGKTLVVLTLSDPVWSTDEGATWQGPQARRDVIDVIRQGGLIWAGSGDRKGDGDGVFLSRDGGLSWTREGLVGLEVRNLRLQGRGPGLLAATRQGVFARNSVPGEAWRRILPQVTAAESVSGEGDILAVVADSGGNRMGWFFSVDGGQSVVSQAKRSQAPPLVYGGRIWAVDSSRLCRFEVKAGNLEATRQALVPESGFPIPHQDAPFYSSLLTGHPYFLLGTTEGLYQSVDSGRTWQLSPSPLGKKSIDYLLRMGDRMAVVNPEGVWTSGDQGRSWAKTDTMTSEVWEKRLAMKSADGMAILTLRSTEMRILSREGRWSQATFPKASPAGFTTGFLLIGTTLLVRDTALYRSEDMGSSWTQLEESACLGPEWGVVGKGVLARGFPGPCPDTVPSMASNPLVLSRDAGRTWTPVEPGRFNPPLPSRTAWLHMVDGLGLIEADSMVHASWNGVDWFSRPARLGFGEFEPTAGGLYRIDHQGVHFLPLPGGPVPFAGRPAMRPRLPMGPQFAGSRFEILTSSVYFPAAGRFNLTARDARGRSFPVRNRIRVEAPGVQAIRWQAPAPGLYLLQLSPEP